MIEVEVHDQINWACIWSKVAFQASFGRRQPLFLDLVFRSTEVAVVLFLLGAEKYETRKNTEISMFTEDPDMIAGWKFQGMYPTATTTGQRTRKL